MPEIGSVAAALTSSVQERPWLAVVAVAVLVALRLATRRRPPGARPGEVWFAMVPFEDGSGAKDRPVLVLEVRGRRCDVACITSQDKARRSDHRRLPPGVPGLVKESWIDLATTTLPRSALRRRAGVPGAGLVAWYRQTPRRSPRLSRPPRRGP